MKIDFWKYMGSIGLSIAWHKGDLVGQGKFRRQLYKHVLIVGFRSPIILSLR